MKTINFEITKPLGYQSAERLLNKFGVYHTGPVQSRRFYVAMHQALRGRRTSFLANTANSKIVDDIKTYLSSAQLTTDEIMPELDLVTRPIVMEDCFEYTKEEVIVKEEYIKEEQPMRDAEFMNFNVERFVTEQKSLDSLSKSNRKKVRDWLKVYEYLQNPMKKILGKTIHGKEEYEGKQAELLKLQNRLGWSHEELVEYAPVEHREVKIESERKWRQAPKNLMYSIGVRERSVTEYKTIVSKREAIDKKWPAHQQMWETVDKKKKAKFLEAAYDISLRDEGVLLKNYLTRISYQNLDGAVIREKELLKKFKRPKTPSRKKPKFFYMSDAEFNIVMKGFNKNLPKVKAKLEVMNRPLIKERNELREMFKREEVTRKRGIEKLDTLFLEICKLKDRRFSGARYWLLDDPGVKIPSYIVKILEAMLNSSLARKPIRNYSEINLARYRRYAGRNDFGSSC